MRSKGHIYTGQEFLELCARVQADGNYIRAVDVVGVSGYRVKAKDILPRRIEGNEGRRPAKAEPEVAQLWFDVLNAI